MFYQWMLPRYVLCVRVDESSIHLFLHCEVAGRVWQGIMGWWEKMVLIPPNLFVSWECWGEEQAIASEA